MKCEDARRLVHAWLDGELDAAERLEIEGHLGTCAACASRYRGERETQAAIRGQGVRYLAPQGLEWRIRRAVRGARERPRFDGPSVAAWIGIAAAAAVLLFGIYAVVLRPRAPEHALAQEIVADHIRSLMPGHLADVAASDQHAVKPWFAGRVDFSPPVPNLDAQGFLLAGGRLDYAGGHPVAAVVYRRRQHVVNVFMWPSGGQSAQVAGADRGYNVRHWSDGGLECWVVSDLNSKELDEFVRLFREAMRA